MMVHFVSQYLKEQGFEPAFVVFSPHLSKLTSDKLIDFEFKASSVKVFSNVHQLVAAVFQVRCTQDDAVVFDNLKEANSETVNIITSAPSKVCVTFPIEMQPSHI